MSKYATELIQNYPCIVFDGNGDIDLARDNATSYALTITVENRVEVIAPLKGKNSISIEQARDVRRMLTLKSTKDHQRVVIIDNISLMGDEAQNTLLKTLEELGDNSTVLLPVSTSSDILDTILSRSHVLTLSHDSSDESKAQKMIDEALLGYKNDVKVREVNVLNAAEFMKYSVADRLHHYKDTGEDRVNIMMLLHSLRVLCISTMRNAPTHDAKLAWSKKVMVANDLIEKARSNASSKLLLLGASTRL